MHRIHPTTGLTYVMRMKTLYARPVASPFASVGPPLWGPLRSGIVPYGNVRRSFQTIA
jgi:hypothetical protein